MASNLKLFVFALALGISSSSFAQSSSQVLFKCGGFGSPDTDGSDIVRIEKISESAVHVTLQMGPFKPTNENLRQIALMTNQPYNAPEFATVLNFDFQIQNCTSLTPLKCTGNLGTGVKIEGALSQDIPNPNPNFDFPNYSEFNLQVAKGTEQFTMDYDCFPKSY